MCLIQAHGTDGFPGEQICPVNQCRTSLNTFFSGNHIFILVSHARDTLQNTFVFVNRDSKKNSENAFSVHSESMHGVLKTTFKKAPTILFIINDGWILPEADFAALNI